jgi:hypothetical protein
MEKSAEVIVVVVTSQYMENNMLKLEVSPNNEGLNFKLLANSEWRFTWAIAQCQPPESAAGNNK